MAALHPARRVLNSPEIAEASAVFDRAGATHEDFRVARSRWRVSPRLDRLSRR